MVVEQLDKYIEVIKKSIDKGQQKQLISQMRYFCKEHPEENIDYYCKENKEFMCHICVFQKDITKKTAFVCNKTDLVQHSS